MNRNQWIRRQVGVFCILIVALVSVTTAQQNATKRSLTHNDYDSWKSIQSPKLSRDGKFLAYALTPQDGDGELVVRNLVTGAEWRSGIGTRVTQAATDDETGVATAPAGAQGPEIFFTHDARFVGAATRSHTW